MTTTLSPTTDTDLAGYEALRGGAGIVDWSDAGLLRIHGPGAADATGRLTTRPVDFLLDGQTQQALVLDEAGHVVADVVVHATGDGYLVQTWPEQAAAVARRAREVVAETGAELEDVGARTAVVGVEGPRSFEIVAPFLDFPVSSLAYQAWAPGTWDGEDVGVVRMGVTGEFGYALLVPAARAQALVRDLEAAGAVRASRAAVDVCRMEMRFPNIEEEVGDAERHPAEIGLQWMVDREADGAGVDALPAPGEQARGTVCWEAAPASTDVPAPGTPVLAGGEVVGEVVSACRSPRCDRVIGTALVARDVAAPGLGLAIGSQEVTTRSAPFLIATSFGVSMG